MNNKGFTLVELLAVIVILAIVLAIAIPSISNIINNSEKSSFVSSTKLLIKAVQIKLLEDETFDITTINKSNMKTLLNISGDNYSSVSFRYDNNGKIYVNIEGQDKWEDLATFGNYENIDITDGIVKDGLVLHLDAGNPISYPGSGNTWNDLSGNGNNATLVNGVGFDTKNGGSMTFDGIDDEIIIGNPSNLKNDEVTIFFFFKPNSAVQFGGIINSIMPNGKFTIYWENTNSIRLQYRDNSGLTMANGGNWLTTTFPSTINANQWYLVHVLAKESTNFFRGGINTTQSNSTTAGQTVTPDNLNWKLGRRGGGSVIFYKGQISNFYVYNRILSATEIEQNFNALRGRYGI